MKANRRCMHGKRVRRSTTAAFKSASAFKHPHAPMEVAANDGHTHDAAPGTYDGSVAVASSDSDYLKKAWGEGEEFEKTMDDRSITDKIIGNSVEQSNERVASSESMKDKAQIAASVSGVILPHADAGNAGASLGRSIDHALGVNVPQSGTQAWKHLKAAGWNLASVIPGVGEVKKTKKVLEGSADLYKSMSPVYNIANVLDRTKKTSTKVKDVIGGVGNWGYWMDPETGTIPSLYNTIFGGDTDDDE